MWLEILSWVEAYDDMRSATLIYYLGMFATYWTNPEIVCITRCSNFSRAIVCAYYLDRFASCVLSVLEKNGSGISTENY